MNQQACGAISPDRAFMCDRPAGHAGDHDGFELPTVTIDEPARAAVAADPADTTR